MSAGGTDARAAVVRRGQAPQPRSGAPQAQGLRAAYHRGILQRAAAVTDGRSRRAEHVVRLTGSHRCGVTALHRPLDVLLADKGEGSGQPFAGEV